MNDMRIKHYVPVFLYMKKGHGLQWLMDRISLAQSTSLHSLRRQVNQDFEVVIVTNYESLNVVRDNLGDRYTYIISKHDKTNKLDKGDFDLVYVTRLDSDDMYHPLALEEIRRYNLRGWVSGLVNKSGYLYDVESNRMAEFDHDRIAFQTVIHRGDEWKRASGLGIYPHGEIWKRYKTKVLSKRRYIFVIHGKNDSSRNSLFNSKWCGRVLPQPEVSKVLKEFKWQRKNISH